MLPETLTPASALQMFAARDFSNWRGLPKRMTGADIVRVYPPEDDWRGVGHLGHVRQKAEYFYVTMPGHAEQTRIWLVEGHVILMDTEYPKLLTGTDKLLAALGAPSAKLDAYFGTLLLTASEWVYADRGLTLFLNPENGILLRLAVFEAMILEDYLSRLRLDLQIQRLPRI